MTTPPQPGPYPGQSGASWPQAAPGQAATPYPGQPQPAYNYGWSSPAYGYPQPQPRGQASAHDRGTAVMLLIGAVLAVAGSFPTLTKSVDSTTGSADTFTNIDKAWTFTGQSADFNQSNLQFLGLPLALGAAVAITVGILLLTGFGARRVPARALGLAAAGFLFGGTLMVTMVAVDDGQFDTATRHTSFGVGFWLVVLSALAALGAAIPGILARFGTEAAASTSQGTATTAGYPAQYQGAQYPGAQYQGQYQYAPQGYLAPPAAPNAYAAQPAPPQPQQAPPQQAQPQQAQPQPAQPQPPQPEAQPLQHPQPHFGGGSGWTDPGQTSASAAPQDPPQPPA